MIDLSRCVVYDVEVVRGPRYVKRGFDNPFGMGFASAVAYEYLTDRYYFFLHNKGRYEIVNLLKGKIAITFNGIKFDSRVLIGNDRAVDKKGRVYTLNGIMYWDNYDILLEVIKSKFKIENIKDALVKLDEKGIHDGTFNLNSICKSSFGVEKCGHGAHAPILYNKGQYDKLLEYNHQDVRLTKRLFEFIREHKQVVDGDGNLIYIGEV